jgi:GTPase involved in cell partitioning and DNA repair
MFKALFFVGVITSSLLFGAWFYERKAHFQTMNKLATCKAELQSTQESLVKYTQLYTDLKSKCELDKKQIEQRYSKLLQKSLEPISQITIPKTENECQALKEMIDEASSYFSK